MSTFTVGIWDVPAILYKSLLSFFYWWIIFFRCDKNHRTGPMLDFQKGWYRMMYTHQEVFGAGWMGGICMRRSSKTWCAFENCGGCFQPRLNKSRVHMRLRDAWAMHISSCTMRIEDVSLNADTSHSVCRVSHLSEGDGTVGRGSLTL